MQIFDSALFWFAEGILFSVMLLGLKVWAQDRGVTMQWWKWTTFLAWVLLTGFTIAFVGTSLAEHETSAAVRGGIFFGMITVLSGVGVWRIVMIGKKSSDLGTITEA
jgi:hypothetical protein